MNDEDVCVREGESIPKPKLYMPIDISNPTFINRYIANTIMVLVHADATIGGVAKSSLLRRDWAGPIKRLLVHYNTSHGVAKPIKIRGVLHTRYDVFQVPTEIPILATGWMVAGKTVRIHIVAR